MKLYYSPWFADYENDFLVLRLQSAATKEEYDYIDYLEGRNTYCDLKAIAIVKKYVSPLELLVMYKGSGR